MRMIVFALFGLATISHFIGFISWMSTTNTNFNRDCADRPSQGYFNINLCAGDGPALSLFIAILLPIYFVCFCFISHKFQHNSIFKNTQINQETIMKPEKQADDAIDKNEKDIQMTVIKNDA